MKQKADEEAINVFAENLRQLLLSAPLGSKRILAIDPGYRTGCKVVCLDEKGELQKTDLIYVHEPNRMYDSEYKIKELVAKYKIDCFCHWRWNRWAGNGTVYQKHETGFAGFYGKRRRGFCVFCF